MGDPNEGLASSLDLRASTILHSPALIFLCGGLIGLEGESHPSLRSLFHEHLRLKRHDLFRRVRLAEEANRWSKTAKHYGNLLELEDDLAYLAGFILLFVESAGSIAELGAFCRSPVLSKKLVAVLEASHNHESFIKDGPVDLLRQIGERNGRRSVHFYPWLKPPDDCQRQALDPEVAQESIGELLDSLSQSLTGPTAEQKFNKANRGHRLLLIADFVDLGIIVIQREIAAFLRSLGVRLALYRR
jgi:hypothetical protein